MVDLLNQVGNIVGGDLVSNIGLARQIGMFFTQDGYEIAGVTIDTILNESHDSSVNLTSQPVEMGADITDHIYANPVNVNLTGIISDVTNNTFFDIGLIGSASALFGKISGNPQQSKSQQSWARLQEIQRKGQLIDIVTNLKTYTNMAIVGMSCTQDKDSALEVRFSMTLREVFIVSSATFQGDIGVLTTDKPTTSVAEGNKPTADRAAGTTDKGELPGKPPDTGSLLYSASQQVSSLFGG